MIEVIPRICAGCSTVTQDVVVAEQDAVYRDGRLWHSQCWIQYQKRRYTPRRKSAD